FAGAPHPDPDRIDAAQAARWLERMLAACDKGAPGRFHVHAEYDAAWYQDGHPFTPAQAARLGAATTVHSWVFNGTAQRHGAAGTATEHHAAYLIELAKAWALDPYRPVWLQEVGAPAPLVPPEGAARFTEATVANALDCPDVWGVTWWCSHDVSRELADFPALEYDLGLLTNDHRVKPAGAALARIAASWRGRAHRPPPRSTALALDVGGAEAAPGRSVCGPGGAFFEAWAALTARGQRPAVVLAELARDPAHLSARGITEVLHVHDVTGTA
ncbi:glycosyl hydrolase, partial [Streptomyces cirratus]